MKKCLLLLILLTGLLANGWATQTPPQLRQIILVNQTCFNVTIISSSEGMYKGLSGQASLPDRHGLLFIYPRPRQARIWMKNMQFPIDILYIDTNKRIYAIKENAPICDTEHCVTYTTHDDNTKYVLELPAGSTQKYQLQLGDRLNLDPIAASLHCHPRSGSTME